MTVCMCYSNKLPLATRCHWRFCSTCFSASFVVHFVSILTIWAIKAPHLISSSIRCLIYLHSRQTPGRIFEVPRSNIQGMVYPQTVQHQWALDPTNLPGRCPWHPSWLTPPFNYPRYIWPRSLNKPSITSAPTGSGCLIGLHATTTIQRR